MTTSSFPQASAGDPRDPTIATQLVGRDTERGAILDALRRVTAGRPEAVLLRGEAGIGKSMLLHAVVAAAQAHTVRWGRADEAEVDAPFALLEHAFGSTVLRPAGPLDWVEPAATIGARLLDLIGELSAGGVALIVLDDVHWADRSSMQALSFALRRLHSEPVLVLAAARPDPAGNLRSFERLRQDGLLREIELLGVQPDAAAALARLEGRADLPESYLRRLLGHTGGHPLHFRSLLAELPAAASGLELLPAPRSLRSVVADRLHRCTDDARALVRAVAVLGGEAPVDMAAQVAQVHDVIAAVEAAVDERLLHSAGAMPSLMLRVPHPLLATAVTDLLPPSQALILHARAADAAQDDGTTLRHLIAAATARDDTLARRAIEHGRSAAMTRAWTVAASWLTRAHHIADDASRAEDALLEAAEYHLVVGADMEASALLQRPTAVPQRARRQLLEGWLRVLRGDYAGAVPLLEEAWSSAPPQEAMLQGRAANLLGVIALLDGRGQRAIGWFREALRCTPPEAAADARGGLAISLALTGQAAQAEALVMHLPAAQPAVSMVDELTAAGQVLLWTDRLDEARQRFRQAVRTSRESAGQPYAYQALGHLAQVEYRAGNWDDAIVHGHLSVAASYESALLGGICASHASVVPAHARRGELAAARRHCDAALALAEQCTDVATTAYAANAAATLHHSVGDYAAVVAATDGCLALDGRDGPFEPGVFEWRELRLEALVRLGRLDECEADLVRFEHLAASRSRRSTVAAAAVVRGLLEAARGRHDLAAEAFDAAVRLFAEVGMPFCHAYAALAQGATLRRAGRRRAAIERLTTAESALRRLGATPHLTVAVRELASCGQVRRPAGDLEPSRLTPSEAVIAKLSETGATNRQIASELVVSVKTVEFHLSRIYRKLGVRNRTELATWAARHSEP